MTVYPPKYKEFQDKEAIYFDNRKIETFSTLQGAFKELKNSGCTYIYRGISDASYKMYSSAQRYWICNQGEDLYGYPFDNYPSYLYSLLHKSKPLKAVQEYLKKEHVHYNEMWLLSLMQHYGAPSVMLDFSHDLYSALFFMCDGARSAVGDTGLGDYVSLYFMNAKLDWVTSNVQNIMSDAVNRVCRDVIPKFGTNDIKAYDSFLMELKNLPFDKFIRDKVDFVSLEGPEKGSLSIDIPELDFHTSYEIINGRLKTQAGLFFANFSESEPFAELLLDACTPKQLVSNNNVSCEDVKLVNYAEKYIHCWNINKCLLTRIKWQMLYPHFKFKPLVYRHWCSTDRQLDKEMKKALFRK